MSVTLSEVKRAAKAHRAPLAGESAGYLVLAVADQVLSAPRLVQASDVHLTEEGALRVLSGRASTEVEAELSLRQALDQLLLVASSGSPALSRAGRRTSPSGLSSLVRELEAALIPVNRAAAKRALARVHRETQRALQSGALPPEEVSVPAPVVVAPPVVAPVVVAPPVVAPPVVAPPVVAPPVVVAEPIAAAPEELGRVLSALCDELAAPFQLEESDALTIALEVRELSAPAPEAAPVVEVIALEDASEAVDSAAAPTVMRALEVAPVVPAALTPAPDLPLEDCTRPEPVVLRKSLRPEAPPPAPTSEPLVRTPTLGSLAASLPVLSPERIAALEAEQLVHEGEIREAIPDLVVPMHVESVDEDSDEVLTSVAPDVYESLSPELETEAQPEVAHYSPLPPGVAMVESKKSDVSELLASFQVGGQSEIDGLPRAIKEMAELDLTPAPFAALIR